MTPTTRCIKILTNTQAERKDDNTQQLHNLRFIEQTEGSSKAKKMRKYYMKRQNEIKEREAKKYKIKIKARRLRRKKEIIIGDVKKQNKKK
jgi:hypothetical protein